MKGVGLQKDQEPGVGVGRGRQVINEKFGIDFCNLVGSVFVLESMNGGQTEQQSNQGQGQMPTDSRGSVLRLNGPCQDRQLRPTEAQKCEEALVSAGQWPASGRLEGAR